MRLIHESLPLKLLRAREAVMERFRPRLNGAGVTEQQWRVLRALYESETMDAGELGRAICLRMPSLSRILVDLARRKLVDKRSGVDRRQRIIRITPRGLALVEAIAPGSEREYRAIEATIGVAEYGRLMADLDRLIARLGNSANDSVPLSPTGTQFSVGSLPNDR